MIDFAKLKKEYHHYDNFEQSLFDMIETLCEKGKALSKNLPESNEKKELLETMVDAEELMKYIDKIRLSEL